MLQITNRINAFFFLSVSKMKGAYTLKVHMTGFLNRVLVLGFFIKLKIHKFSIVKLVSQI